MSETPEDAARTEVAALRYNPQDGDSAPRMVAHGRGVIAERILELAGQHDIPIRQDPTLISILGALDVGAEIPPGLYGVIAEVLAWAYQTDTAAAAVPALRRAA